MEIRILGTDDDSNEYAAANRLKELISPGLLHIKGKICIKPNLKVPNTNTQQLDLVIWGEFENGYETPYSINVRPKNPRNNFLPIENEGNVFLVSSGEGLYDPAPGTLVVSFISGNF